MTKEKTDLKAALGKILGLPILDHLIDQMPSDAELFGVPAELHFHEVADLELGDLDFDFAAALKPARSASGKPLVRTPCPISSGTTRITIRVNTRVLAAMKTKARAKCLGYQTYINRILKTASRG